MSSSKKSSKSKGSSKGKKAKAKTAKPEAATTAAPEAPAEPKQKADGKMSGLDAAAKVLAEAGEPLNCKAITERMLAGGLWQTEGKTPWATIYSAMLREIAQKGEASRFRKADRGKFEMAK